MARGKTFRDASYYAHVWLGKRTVKEGECAAVWLADGRRKLRVGPVRVRLWFAHVRFLDRKVADGNEYLEIQFRDGRKEHRRGPCSLFVDPCVHQSCMVVPAFKLAANEALVIYREHRASCEEGAPTAADKAAADKAATNKAATNKAAVVATGAIHGGGDIGMPADVLRRVVSGPAVYVPRHDEWVHTFSWHGSPRANGGGSKTGSPNDDKVPHALTFTTLRQMPDQMYVTVRDVRTKDDAQIAVHLMIFYELRSIERMLDSTNDPIGDFINAMSADVMSFGARNTYESLLERTDALGELGTFPTVRDRMDGCGYGLLRIVYRGYSTSAKLQSMHDEAIAKRTQLRLQSATARVEQAEQAMMLTCREERSLGEHALAADAARHGAELLHLAAVRAREERDADHAQELRHEAEAAKVRNEQAKRDHDEELRRAGALKALGVDLTKLLCVDAERQPDQHVRIDSATPTAVHLGMGKF